MKKLYQAYRKKVLATPNILRASQINFILGLLCAFITIAMFPSVLAGNILSIVLAFFTIVLCIDGMVSWHIQRKELKQREKAKK